MWGEGCGEEVVGRGERGREKGKVDGEEGLKGRGVLCEREWFDCVRKEGLWVGKRSLTVERGEG